MNAKQTAPLLVTLPALAAAAPALIIGGAIGLGVVLVLKSLLSDDDKEKKPKTVPANKAEIPRINPEPAVFRQIPAEIPAKPAVVTRPAAPRVVIAPPAVPSVPKIPSPAIVPAAVIVPKIAAQAPSPPIKKKCVTREEMATVFQRGAGTLSRTAAVAALKSLGFGKTAAYAALTPNGRFSSWLQIAPDGIIAWIDGHKA
ncbi:MAG: hypothetical protein ACLP2Y_18695 [Limisphaerales bacterium]